MKYLLLMLLLIGVSCSKHKDPGFTSATGSWSYATPDNKIAVTFDLVQNSAGALEVSQQSIKIDGASYQAVHQISAITATSIQKLRINANDPKAVYGYNIEFTSGTVSNDFKTITFATATYTWPWGTVNSLSSVKVTRVQ